MKKVTLGAALTAALTIISCTKADFIEQQDQIPIAFDAAVGKSSRAIINGTVYPTTESFNVTAYYKPQGGSYNFADAGKYFDYLQISYVSASSLWRNASSVYYWPPKGALKFIATSPYNKVYPTYSATNGIQISEFGQYSPPIDLMYAESANDLTSGPVVLTFKHALTQLYFTMQTTQVGVSFKIKRIDVRNISNNANFKSLPTPTWTLVESKNSFFNVYTSSTGVSISSTDAAPYEFPNRLLVIPQAVTGVVIRITYDYWVAGVLSLSGVTKDVTLSGSPWLANQRIKYAITISYPSLPITYSPTVTDWSIDTDGSITD